MIFFSVSLKKIEIPITEFLYAFSHQKLIIFPDFIFSRFYPKLLVLFDCTFAYSFAVCSLVELSFNDIMQLFWVIPLDS